MTSCEQTSELRALKAQSAVHLNNVVLFVVSHSAVAGVPNRPARVDIDAVGLAKKLDSAVTIETDAWPATHWS